MTIRRERPSGAEVDAWVAAARPHVMSHARSRRWRRLSRPVVALGAVGVVAAGGIAYAAVERTRTPEPPATVRGDTTIAIGRPAPGDKWLNLTISYRCKPGEGFDLRDGGRRLARADCDQQSFPDPHDPAKIVPGAGGIQRSIPVDEVRGTQLTLESTLTDAAVVKAEFGPTSALSGPVRLPPNGPEGEPAWKLPTYRVNEFGLTVGNIMIDVPESAYPDLIPFEHNGKEVYVLKKSFIVRESGRPGEFSLAEEMRARGVRRDDDGQMFYRGYEADGKTFVGWVDSGYQVVGCSAC